MMGNQHPLIEPQCNFLIRHTSRDHFDVLPLDSLPIDVRLTLRFRSALDGLSSTLSSFSIDLQLPGTPGIHSGLELQD